jgi:(p)ppGpp synthase/HD superfamily hydrolase
VEHLPSNEQLLAMPLHSISLTFGEAGLNERFNLEVQRFEPAQQEQMSQARDLALHLHRHNRRWRGTYGEHLLRVALRVMAPSHYGVNNHNLVIASLLHDSVEDHAEELAGQEASEEFDAKAAALVLGRRFGEEVKLTVGAVTNPKFDKKADWRSEYRKHVKQSMLEVPSARVVKVSDFTDNGAGILYSNPDRQAHFATKYAPLVPVFRRIIPLPDTPLSDRAKSMILDQLSRTEGRFANILD